MLKSVKYLFILSFLFFLNIPVFAEEKLTVKNAGFIPSNIWYSKDPFFAGDKVRIYTVIFNGSVYDISGNIEFYDNNILISKQDFAISGNGRLRDVWADWIVKDGSHTISVKIVEPVVSEDGGIKKVITLENETIGKSERIVDFDTDNDGIGNKDDSDDDNDGVSDVEEIKKGTDPLKNDNSELKVAISQDKAVGENYITDKTKTVEEKIKDVVEVVDDNIPTVIKEGVSSGVGFVEDFRIGQEDQFRMRKEEKAKEIKNSNNKEDPSDKEESLIKTPIEYAILSIFAILQYFFKWKIIFYVLLFYLLYRLSKWIIRILRRPRY